MRRALLALSLVAAPAVASAEAAWPWIQEQLFAERGVASGAGVATLIAPRRAEDDRAVPIGMDATLPFGAAISSMTLVIDENPMPVSAVVRFAEPTRAASFEFTMRLNGPSPVHAVVEADDGRIYVSEAVVKTSGLGACAAPPVTDETLALESLGRMTLTADAPDAPAALRALGGAQDVHDGGGRDRVRLAISHPSLSGLQMDQITLLYRPARFIETLEVWADDAPLFTITGSISLSENPSIAFDRPRAAQTLRVRMTDTDGAVSDQRFALGQS